jgi:hypothetical protein
MHRFVDHRSGDTHNTVLLRKVGKLDGLDHIGSHEVTGDGQMVCEHHGSRAVRSGGCDEHLNVYRFLQILEKRQGIGH